MRSIPMPNISGFPVVIESRAGEVRHGKYLFYHYGYIQDTKGSDGEEVDVFVGPNHNSPFVYVIKQMKAPEFTTYDEDKVFLGFDSSSHAKEAYCKQYTDKHFGGIKKFSVLDFSDKLRKPVNITSSKGNNRMSKSLKAIEQLKEATAQLSVMKDVVKNDVELSKAMRAAAAAGIAKQARLGTARTRMAHEPPVVPVRRVGYYPVAQPLRMEEVFVDCAGCGYVHKSTTGCPKCDKIARENHVAKDFYRR
jgi:rubrerythrin